MTQRKALEAQFVQAQKMEVLGQLAGGVAHDFNSVLMAMMLQCEMLETQLKMQSVPYGIVTEVKSMARGAARLVEQLLLFARRQTMKPELIDLNAALSAIGKMLRRLIGADIVLDLRNSGEPLWVKADPSMLDQVVLNLTVNARDAMPHGGTLTISTSQIELTGSASGMPVGASPGRYACLQVGDTGCGMTPEVQARVFEPFFTTKDVGKGTGLGLSTVHGVIHQHRGWVAVESAVDRGSTFSVFLPLREPPEPEADRQEEVEVRGGSETIMLVEDNQTIRRYCAAMLLRLGYRVLPAANAQEARRIWDQNMVRIDLLVTDLVLPGNLNGFQLAEGLRVQRPSLKVVLMSGDNTQIIRALREEEQGWYKFVQKPVESTVLAITIRKSLDGHQVK